MTDLQCGLCGGCPLRMLQQDDYRNKKVQEFKKIISEIKATPVFDEPIFIEDSLRRRAEFAFSYHKKELKLGFNEKESHNIVNLTSCYMLDSDLSKMLFLIHEFLKEFISIPINISNKKKKIENVYIKEGSVRLLKADNGIDMMLILPYEPNVNHRMLVAEFINNNSEIIRISWQINNSKPEEVVAKSQPKLYISGYEIDIPNGAFLQASKKAETKMIEKVVEYLGQAKGNIADLFCGLGTFTYPLSKIKGCNILSVDSSEVSLKGLEKAIAYNQIHSVKVINKNLFKYPLDKEELKSISTVVIDPPRAGAHAQCREICDIDDINKPSKIIFISCNPKTFVYDANMLISSNYVLEKITLVDQFVYSNHMELIALFNLNPKNKE